MKQAPCQASSAAVAEQNWQKAVQFYSSNYASRDMLFDRAFAHINDVLSDVGDVQALPATLPPDLRSELEAAAPVYRQSCWPNHRRLNEVWIHSLETLVAAHGPEIAGRLTTVFNTEWPAQPIPVDVVTYANWAGAYTISSPPHTTIGSVGDDNGDAQLETVFHEALHAMNEPMDRDVSTAFAKYHSQMPHDFVHVLIFFTAGFVVQQQIHATDPNFQPYAYRHGMYKRIPYWDQDEMTLRKYWQPYLEGKEQRQAALDHLAHAICCS